MYNAHLYWTIQIDDLKVVRVQLCNCFSRNKINVSLKEEKGFDFCWQGVAIRICLWAKCKESYVFLMTELWNICTIFPSDYWLVSFLIFVNYLVGIFISCLMFLYLKCLLTVGEIQYCIYSVALWFICYASQSFKCSWFSVCFGLMNVFLLVFKVFNQNPISPILLYCDYWDCVSLFFCSLRTNSGTNRIYIE